MNADRILGLTNDQWLGLARLAIGAGAAWAVKANWLTAEQAADLSGKAVVVIGAVAVVAAAWWSIHSNRPAKIVNTVTAQPKDVPAALKEQAVATGTAPSQQ